MWTKGVNTNLSCHTACLVNLSSFIVIRKNWLHQIPKSWHLQSRVAQRLLQALSVQGEHSHRHLDLQVCPQDISSKVINCDFIGFRFPQCLVFHFLSSSCDLKQILWVSVDTGRTTQRPKERKVILLLVCSHTLAVSPVYFHFTSEILAGRCLLSPMSHWKGADETESKAPQHPMSSLNCSVYILVVYPLYLFIYSLPTVPQAAWGCAGSINSPHSQCPKCSSHPWIWSAACACPQWSSLACLPAQSGLSASAGHRGGCPGWLRAGCCWAAPCCHLWGRRGRG